MSKPSLGSNENPLWLRVQTLEQADAMIMFCNRLGLLASASVDPDQPPDISDLRKVLGLYQRVSNKVPRNAPCPCQSGKKYKKCCAHGGGVSEESSHNGFSSPIG